MIGRLLTAIAFLSFVGCSDTHAGENYWVQNGPSYSCTRGWYYEDGSAEKFYDEHLRHWVTPDHYRETALAIRKEIRRDPEVKRPPFGNKGKEKTDRPYED